MAITGMCTHTNSDIHPRPYTHTHTHTHCVTPQRCSTQARTHARTHAYARARGGVQGGREGGRETGYPEHPAIDEKGIYCLPHISQTLSPSHFPSIHKKKKHKSKTKPTNPPEPPSSPPAPWSSTRDPHIHGDLHHSPPPLRAKTSLFGSVWYQTTRRQAPPPQAPPPPPPRPARLPRASCRRSAAVSMPGTCSRARSASPAALLASTAPDMYVCVRVYECMCIDCP